MFVFHSGDSLWPLNTLLYGEINPKIYGWFDNVTNTSSATIKDAFPTKFDELLKSMQDAFLFLFYDLAYLLPKYVYWEIPGFDHFQYHVNASFGSELYHQIKNDFNASFVQSGVLKSFLKSGLVSGSNSAEEVTFDELADTVYREFNIEKGFDVIFPFMYTKQHAVFIKTGLRIREETDVSSLMTTYMR